MTLRQLLIHHSGFGYPVFDKRLKSFANDFGIDSLAKNNIHLPLVHEPGEGWIYGVGIDWAGILISRAEINLWKPFFKKISFSPLESKMSPCVQAKMTMLIKWLNVLPVINKIERFTLSRIYLAFLGVIPY